MVVGDDAQSIYSFRGAEYQNILFFPKSFSDCKIYKIEENYRSTTPILNFTNDVINNSTFSYKKNLYSSKTEGEKPIVLSTKNERQQSLFIVQHILEERENGLNLNDVAILFRSNFHSFDLEIELNKANIPYKKYGGLKFIESAHVKDLLAYLRIIYNEKDMVSLNRVLRLIKGVGNATINRISEEYSKENSNIVEMLNSAKNLKSKDDLIILFGLISEFRNKYQDKLEILISKIIDYYTPYLTENYENDNKRLQDLDTIKQIAERYSNLEGFLNDLSIDPAIASVEDIEGESKEDEFITLSTIHSAKGLEWKTVILIWALDGKFPSSKAADKTESLEEERRLFYVATTRAKDNLYITYPTNIYDTESGFVLSKHCRFIDDASDDSYDTYTLVEEE
jgi:DNA helicase-2/ATP-dependent DNA helicase PcrA